MSFIDNLISPLNKLWQNRGGQSFSTIFSSRTRRLNKTQQLREYKNLVAMCIDLIAKDVALYEPLAYTELGKEKNYRPHPFLDLIQRPNSTESKYDFLIAHESFMLLSGESFWFVAKGENTGKPKELYWIRPDVIDIVKDDNEKSETYGEVIGYVHKPKPGIEIPLDLDEVIHFKTFNPLDNTRGLGSIEKHLLYIETEQNISEFQNSFIKNQATPSGVLNVKNKISKENFKKLKKKWMEAHAGTVNTGKTLFIRNSEVDFQKVGLALNDLDLGNIKPLAKDDVLEAFGVPEALLGKSDMSGLGRANIETIEYNFAKRNIDTRYSLLDSTIERYIQSTYKDDIQIEHENLIPQDKEFLLLEKEKSVGKWRTINEIRKMENAEPIEGGDELYYNFNQVPINSTRDEIVENDYGSIKVKVKKDAMMELANGLTAIEKEQRKFYESTFRKYLDSQKADVMEVTENAFKKVKSIEAILAVIFATAAAYETLKEGLLFSLIATFEQSGQLGYDFLDVDENFLIDQAQRDFLFESTDRLILSFNEQTANRIQQQLAQGLANNENLEQLSRRIESVYNEAGNYRAERIARTETHKASNYGVAESYSQQGYVKMRWIALPNACQFCASMHGKITTIGSPFIPKGMPIEGIEGGEYVADYEDVGYADLHPNCDCRLEPVGSQKSLKEVEQSKIVNTLKEAFEKERLESSKRIKEIEQKLIESQKLIEKQSKEYSEKLNEVDKEVDQKVKNIKEVVVDTKDKIESIDLDSEFKKLDKNVRDIAVDIFKKIDKKTEKKLSDIEKEVISSIDE